MLIDNVKLPKIINDVAKFDARKKKYVPYRSALDNSSADKKLEVLLLAELQTKWEKLQKQSTVNNKLSNFLKSTAKYYRQALTLSDREFTSTSAYMRCFDKQWLHWNQALCQFQNDLYEQLTPLHKSSFSEFQTYVNDKSAKEYKSKKALKIAWQTITSFIDYQNKHFMLAEHYYPKIIAPQPTKSNTLIINADWVTRGKELTKIILAAREHWYETTNYSHDEILGWLLFSGIVYGGINEKQMLQGWLAALLTKEHQAFIHQRVFVSPRFAQKRYGNERVEDSDKLYNTKQIILDLVSQCWLIRYHQQSDQKDIKHALAQLSQEKIEHYLTNALAIVTEPLKLNTLTLSRLLYYASYHWEMLDNVDIDQASVAVLRGNQNTAGLPSHGFNQLLNQNYKNKVQDYDLKNILKLSISATALSETAPISSSYKKAEVRKAEVRKADLIIQLNKDFKQTEELKKKKLNYIPHTLIERIKKRCYQYTDLSEAILLEWVLSLLSQNKPPSSASILQYIKTVGYEWLYFTMAQPLDIWSEEDFETLYEDILEYKAVARGNTDIVYSANLFQRMHNFAKDKYGLPAVTLQQSKNGRRVRADLVSPQAYRAIIKQILASIDILEREMFALIFILAYRTGMRKKELLGLKYNDIEGLNELAPSVVIRPNSYRSTKTQSSIRRVAIFALLKPDELSFFINFIQSNIGANPNKFIFTLSFDHRPIDDHVPLQLLKRVLQDISSDGNKTSHTFHAFRHTAVSNLSLVLLGHADLIESLTDYNKGDVLRIKHGLMGEHIDVQDRWYALSGMMGHLSPQRSFEYYNHIATLMATYALSDANIKLPTQTLRNIAGFTNKQLKENHATINNHSVNIPTIRTLLFKNTIKGMRKSPRFMIENHDNNDIFYTAPSSAEEMFTRYGLNRVQLLLQTYDKEIPLSKAAQLANISIHDAKVLIERASEVANITTKRGKPRFVKLSDSNNSVLSPLNIQYQSDLRLLSLLLSNAYRLREKSETDWTWFIEICREKLSNSRAYLPFGKRDEKELQRFIGIAEKLLPLKRWLMSSNEALLMKTMSSTDYQDIKQQSNESKNALHIGIASQDHREQTNKWQYSPLLRFFVHMMLITDEKLSIGIFDQTDG